MLQFIVLFNITTAMSYLKNKLLKRWRNSCSVVFSLCSAGAFQVLRVMPAHFLHNEISKYNLNI